MKRQEDGRFATDYCCSKEELKAARIGQPPPRWHRHDGWTAERIAEFLETLRATASVTDACRAVDMSRTSAYKLYHRKDAAHVRKAWDEALRHCTAVLATTAFDRAVNGVEDPVFHEGQVVGRRTKYDNRHLQWMLRARDPLNWAPLDDLDGWLRHRSIEKHEPVEPSLDRVRAAEEEWGLRLRGESGAEGGADGGKGCTGGAEVCAGDGALPVLRDRDGDGDGCDGEETGG